MPRLKLNFEPIRNDLYAPQELYAGFIAQDRHSFAATTDFYIYAEFIKSGGANSGDQLMSMMQSLHDNSITNALRSFLTGRKCVAIMGGHELKRTDEAYEDIVSIARNLTRNGFLLASGGGPGAMEATHLGALTARISQPKLETMLNKLRKAPALPDNMKDIVKQNGKIQQKLVIAAHEWLKPAIQILKDTKQPGASVSIPTWLYGHEPSTPFATHIAKYFQNSIREDGLLGIANYGVIYAKGRAGTIQEIFQDSVQNYYLTFGFFSPMVFLGVEHWTETYPIWPVLKKLFTPELRSKFILLTNDVSEAVEFISNFAPPPTRKVPADMRHAAKSQR
jgi:hypothetical protein